MTILFWAAGRPRTKGSTRTIISASTGRPFTQGANAQACAWQGVVAHAAHQGGVRPLDGGVDLEMEFYFLRPKGHYGTGRNAEKLKDSAPHAPIGRGLGDLDKLARAVLDGLTGIAYADDSQVVSIQALKLWTATGRLHPVADGAGAGEGVLVRVSRELGGEGPTPSAGPA